MNKILFPAVLVAASLLCAPLAGADPASDYDQYMISHGMTGDGPGKNTLEFLLQNGTNTCAGINQGRTDAFLTQQLITAYGLGKAQAEVIVYAAHQYLCP